MDRWPSPQALCPSADRPGRIRLPRASAQSIWADVCPDPSDGSANTDDNRRAMLHSVSRKNPHSRAPAFSPSKLADKKFRSSARRRRKCLRSWNHDLSRRDTSCRTEEEVQALSYAFHSKGVTTAGHATSIHECSLRAFQQLFNHRFGFISVYDLGADHVVT